MSAIIFSCSEDDSALTNNIIGKWKVVSIEYEGMYTFEIDTLNVINTSDFTGIGEDMDLNIEFSKNPNDYISSGSYNVKLILDAQGQMVEANLYNQEFIGTGSWNIDSETIVLTEVDKDPQSVSVVSVDESILVLEWKSIQAYTALGATETYDFIGFFTFNKQ